MRGTVTDVLVGVGVTAAFSGIMTFEKWRLTSKLKAMWKPKFSYADLESFDACIDALGEDFSSLKFNWCPPATIPTNLNFIQMADIQSAIRQHDQSETAVLSKMGLSAAVDLHQRLMVFHLSPQRGGGSPDDLYTVCAMKTIEVLLRWFESIEKKSLTLEAEPDKKINMTQINDTIARFINFLAKVEEMQGDANFLGIKRQAFGFNDFAKRLKKLRLSYIQTLQPVVVETFRAYQSDLPRQLNVLRSPLHDVLERLRAITPAFLMRDLKLTENFMHHRTTPLVPPEFFAIDASGDSSKSPRVLMSPQTPEGKAYISFGKSRGSLASAQFIPPSPALPFPGGERQRCPKKNAIEAQESAYHQGITTLFKSQAQLCWLTHIIRQLSQGRAALFISTETQQALIAWLELIINLLSDLKDTHFFVIGLKLNVFYENSSCPNSEDYFQEISALAQDLDGIISTLRTLQGSLQRHNPVDANLLQDKIDEALAHIAELAQEGLSIEGPTPSPEPLQQSMIAQTAHGLYCDVVEITTGMSDLSLRAQIQIATFLLSDHREPTPLELSSALFPEEEAEALLDKSYQVLANQVPSDRVVKLHLAVVCNNLGPAFFPYPSASADWVKIVRDPESPAHWQQIANLLLAWLENTEEPCSETYTSIHKLLLITSLSEFDEFNVSFRNNLIFPAKYDKALPPSVSIARDHLRVKISNREPVTAPLFNQVFQLNSHSINSSRDSEGEAKTYFLAALQQSAHDLNFNLDLGSLSRILMYPDSLYFNKDARISQAVIVFSFIQAGLPQLKYDEPHLLQRAATRIILILQSFESSGEKNPFSENWKHRDKLKKYIKYQAKMHPELNLTLPNCRIHHLFQLYSDNLLNFNKTDDIIEKTPQLSDLARLADRAFSSDPKIDHKVELAALFEQLILPNPDFFKEKNAAWATQTLAKLPKDCHTIETNNRISRYLPPNERAERKWERKTRILNLKNEARTLIKTLPVIETDNKIMALESALNERIMLYRRLNQSDCRELRHYKGITWATFGRSGTSQTWAKISGRLAADIALLDLRLQARSSELNYSYNSPVANSDDIIELITAKKSGLSHRFSCKQFSSETGKVYRAGQRLFFSTAKNETMEDNQQKKILDKLNKKANLYDNKLRSR